MLLKIRLLACGAAGCAYAMKGFAIAHAFSNRKSHNTRSDLSELVASLICLPISQVSYLFFKPAYACNELRLGLLCGEEFFLKFYDRTVARGNIVDVMQSLRYIKSGFDSAEAGEYFSNHSVFSKP